MMYIRKTPILRLTSGMRLTIVCDCPGIRRDGISMTESLG